jgi:hypothetical protein
MSRAQAVERLYRFHDREKRMAFVDFPRDPPSTGLTLKAFFSMFLGGSSWGG